MALIQVTKKHYVMLYLSKIKKNALTLLNDDKKVAFDKRENYICKYTQENSIF